MAKLDGWWLAAADMTAAQRDLLWQLVEAYAVEPHSTCIPSTTTSITWSSAMREVPDSALSVPNASTARYWRSGNQLARAQAGCV